MTTLGKIIILVLGYGLLIPAGFMIMSDNIWIILCGVIYFVVMVFGGDKKDRKFWRLWYALHCRLCNPWLKYDK